jgi:two-component system, LuxR family, response regulator FixJ
MTAPPVRNVYLVDDDVEVSTALARVLGTYGLAVMAFTSAEHFLENCDALQGGCVVADMRMPGKSGLELQQVLARLRDDLPVVLITGHGDVPMAVAAMKAGARDFLSKPIDDAALVAAIEQALSWADARQAVAKATASVRARHARLTAREMQVMTLVVSGDSNAVIAAKLKLSPRTVEHYRAQVMIKMEAGSLAALVQMSGALQEPGAGGD